MTTTKCDFPIKGCRKQDLYKYFNYMDEKEVRETIIETIMEKRGVERKKAANTKTVRKNEVLAILVALGEIEE